MIVGIGTDIVEIERIRKAASPHFLERFFTLEERDYLNSKPIQSTAGIFAAKEAAAKALSTGFYGFMPWDIEIMHDSLCKPYVRLYAGAKEQALSLSIKRITVSISHCKEYAVAFAIAEGDNHEDNNSESNAGN